ncbi:rhomboid-domain-containing protein [Panus rudis PR-1116 ss-1]|nr:rhomboid-domain-containing protein [Panus rudis PR-1116 ss-1]
MFRAIPRPFLSARFLPRTCRHRTFSFTPNYLQPRSVAGKPLAFREQLAREDLAPSFTEKVQRPSIRNQVLFFVFGSFVVFSLAAKRTDDETAYWSKKLSETGNLIFKLRPPSSEEMRRARHLELGKTLKAGLVKLQEAVEEWPVTIKNTAVWTYIQLLQPVLETPEGKRICWAIGFLNGAIWLAWKIPRLQPFMMRSFTHHPLSGLSYTLLTSMFSHKSFVHLLFNCMALTGFGSAATVYMMRSQQQSPTGLQEATVKWHFLAFFISAGLFSGLASHVVAARIHFPRLVAELRSTVSASGKNLGSGSAAAAAAKESRPILPSLGASGAIYAAVTLSALAFPETHISLIFPPTPPIPIQVGVSGLVLLDIIGALRGWRLFDHWAHLGGAAFGVFYYYCGPAIWDMFRIANLSVPAKVKDGKSKA